MGGVGITHVSVLQLHWHTEVFISSEVNSIACCMSCNAMQSFQRISRFHVVIGRMYRFPLHCVGKDQLKRCVSCNGFKVSTLRVQFTPTICSAPAWHFVFDVWAWYLHILNRLRRLILRACGPYPASDLIILRRIAW